MHRLNTARLKIKPKLCALFRYEAIFRTQIFKDGIQTERQKIGAVPSKVSLKKVILRK